MSNFFDRMMQFATANGYKNVNDFAVRGLQYNSAEKLNRLKKNGANPSINIIQDISNKFETIDLNWLIMDKTEETENKKLYVKAPQGRLPKRKKDKGLIDFYDIDFAAGDVEFYEDQHIITPAYQMDIPEFSGCTAFRTYNNSMEKIIHSGDILFGTNELQWRDGVEYGQVYGIVCKDRRKFLKYIRKSQDKEETHFLLRSENDAEYDDFSFPKDKIKSIWLIHGWLKKRI